MVSPNSKFPLCENCRRLSRVHSLSILLLSAPVASSWKYKNCRRLRRATFVGASWGLPPSSYHPPAKNILGDVILHVLHAPRNNILIETNIAQQLSPKQTQRKAPREKTHMESNNGPARPRRRPGARRRKDRQALDARSGQPKDQSSSLREARGPRPGDYPGRPFCSARRPSGRFARAVFLRRKNSTVQAPDVMMFHGLQQRLADRSRKLEMTSNAGHRKRKHSRNW